MEMELWKGDWGLPTVEFSCLQALSLIKISGAKVDVRYTTNPFTTPGGQLPSLKYSKNQEPLHKFEKIRSLLIAKNFSPDLDLSPKELAESFAYRKMVEEKLYPALRYTWWVDTKNYETLTRPWYAETLSFPFNFYYPPRYKGENEDAIHALYEDLEESEIELKVYREAEKCLTCLSNRLGNNEFFFSRDHPTSLDALVYGCLAPLMKAPFSSNVLQNHARASANLWKFTSRMTQKYFSHEQKEYDKKKREKDEKEESKKSSDSLPNKRRNQIMAAAFALVASVTFGLYYDIFTIIFSNVKNVEIEVEHDVDESSD